MEMKPTISPWLVCTLLFRFTEGLLTISSPAILSTVSTVTCPVYYYYDHGTENCEFCCDICCQAHIKKTTAQCETDCHDYAQKLRDEDAQQMQSDTQRLRNGGTPQKSVDSEHMDFPLLAQGAVWVATAIIIFVLIGLVIAKRKAIVSMCSRQTQASATVDLAAVSLQPVLGSWQPDSEEEIQQLLSKSGVQESRKASPGEGNSWRILSEQQTSSSTYRDRGGVCQIPIPMTFEGAQGPAEIAVCTSRVGINDNTEQKTFLSMAESQV